MIFTAIISAILAIFGVIGFIWLVPGVPLGIIFTILAISKKQPDQKKKFQKFALISFGGIALLIVVFILTIVMGFLGVSSGLSMPPAP